MLKYISSTFDNIYDKAHFEHLDVIIPIFYYTQETPGCEPVVAATLVVTAHVKRTSRASKWNEPSLHYPEQALKPHEPHCVIDYRTTGVYSYKKKSTFYVLYCVYHSFSDVR